MEVRRELDNINKHFNWLYHAQGRAILWYEFIPVAAGGSSYDDIYDEGNVGVGGIKYKSGVLIPALRVTEVEDTKRAIPEGRLPFQNVMLFISAEAMNNSGVSSPWEYESRLYDMFKWDGRFYTVVDYKVRGHLMGNVYYMVTGQQVYTDQEMVNDPVLTDTTSIEMPWPANLPILG